MSFNFGKYNALKKKREERESIEKAGGGHAIAKAMLKGGCTHDPNTCKAEYCAWPRCNEPDPDTDFNFGANEQRGRTDQEIEDDYNQRCMTKVECPACGRSHGFCAELTESKMLPTGNESTSSRRQAGKSGIKWLKPEDLSTQPKEAKILKVNYNQNGRFGSRVELKLAFEGEIVYWGVDPKKDSKNPNYKDLTAKFTHDENNWVNQRILLYVEAHPFYEGQYNIRVDFPKKGR